MRSALTGPWAYVVVLVAVFAIAFGVGRAWGPDVEPVTHDAPTHGVVTDEPSDPHGGDHP